MSTSEDYTIRVAMSQDIPIINVLLEENFHPEETLLQCLLSNPHNSHIVVKEINDDQRRLIEIMITHNTCYVLVYKPTNEITGAIITIIDDNPNIPINERRSVDVYQLHGSKYKFLQDYYDYMNDMIEKAELYVNHPSVKRIMELYAITIDKKHRRKGLSVLLIKAAIDYARSIDIDLVYGLFTSPYSMRAALTIGMKNYMDIDLLKYRGKDGTLPFRRSSHSIATIMIILTNPCDISSK